MGLQLTRASEYAIRAMMYLAGRPAGEISSLHDLGREQNIPASFLAQIFQKLARGGLVVGKTGYGGGFALARPGSEISVAEVVQATDGPQSLSGCVLWPASCEGSASRGMRAVWVRAQERMMAVLNEVTLADLVPLEDGSSDILAASGQPLRPS